MEITEFDEQSITKEEALALVKHAFSLYKKDLETFGVLSGYVGAALKKGATQQEIDKIFLL